jgi:hypothetical protein
MLRSFGAGLHLALAGQCVSTLSSGLLLWQLWRIPGRPALPRMAATLALTMLFVPYGYLYDLVGFSIGMAALCVASSPGRQPIYAALWLFGGHSASIASLTGHVLMPIALALAVFMAWTEPAVPQTPPHAHSPA